MLESLKHDGLKFKRYCCSQPLLCIIMASGVRCLIFILTEGVFKGTSCGKWVTRTSLIRTTYTAWLCKEFDFLNSRLGMKAVQKSVRLFPRNPSSRFHVESVDKQTCGYTCTSQFAAAARVSILSKYESFFFNDQISTQKTHYGCDPCFHGQLHVLYNKAV